MSTEKEDFLETLKNPTKARLKRAAAELYETHPNSIYSTIVYEHHEGEYTIEIIGQNHISWYEMEVTLIGLIRKYLKHPLINIRIHPEKVDELFKRTYYITEA